MIKELAKRLHEDRPDTFCLTDAEARKLAGELSGMVIDRNKRPCSTPEIHQSMRKGECTLFGTPVRVYD